jgi:hypothetical protein
LVGSNACCHGYFSIFLIKNLILLIKLKHVKQWMYKTLDLIKLKCENMWIGELIIKMKLNVNFTLWLDPLLNGYHGTVAPSHLHFARHRIYEKLKCENMWIGELIINECCGHKVQMMWIFLHHFSIFSSNLHYVFCFWILSYILWRAKWRWEGATEITMTTCIM